VPYGSGIENIEVVQQQGHSDDEKKNPDSDVTVGMSFFVFHNSS
jgi:hypothetical protein